MGTAYTSNEDRSPLVRDENGDLVEGDAVSTRIRNYPRDFVTVNLAAEYPMTKKWIALLELTSTWDGGRLIGHKANVAPTPLLNRCRYHCPGSSTWPRTNSPWPWE
jgi:hypothetical protein